MHGWKGAAGLHARIGGVVGGRVPGVKLEHASMPNLACGVDVHLDGCLHLIPYGHVC